MEADRSSRESVYHFPSEDAPPLTLKMEIHSREHFSVYGFTRLPVTLQSRWFEGNAETSTYALDGLLATERRALYRRRKGRDLFDLAVGLS